MCSLFLHKRQPWFVHNSLTDLKRRTISGSLRRKLKEILVGPTIKQSGTGSCPGDKMATTSRGKSGNGLQPNVPLGSTVAFKCSNPVCLSSLREGTQLSKFFAPFTPRSTDHPHPNLLTPSALGRVAQPSFRVWPFFSTWKWLSCRASHPVCQKWAMFAQPPPPVWRTNTFGRAPGMSAIEGLRVNRYSIQFVTVNSGQLLQLSVDGFQFVLACFRAPGRILDHSLRRLQKWRESKFPLGMSRATVTRGAAWPWRMWC